MSLVCCNVQRQTSTHRIISFSVPPIHLTTWRWTMGENWRKHRDTQAPHTKPCYKASNYLATVHCPVCNAQKTCPLLKNKELLLRVHNKLVTFYLNRLYLFILRVTSNTVMDNFVFTLPYKLYFGL